MSSTINPLHLQYMGEAADVLRDMGNRYAKTIHEAPNEDQIYALTNIFGNVITGYEKISKLALQAEKNQIDASDVAANRLFLQELHDEDVARFQEVANTPAEERLPDFERDKDVVLHAGEVLQGQDNEGLAEFRNRHRGD